MASNYTQFSEILTLKTPEEIKWAQDYLLNTSYSEIDEAIMEWQVRLDEQEITIADVPEQYRNSDNSYVCEVWDCPEYLYFEHQLDIAKDGQSGSLWMYSEESGDLGHVATLVHEYLKRFDPFGSEVLHEAWTCSRLRVGEFGGNEVFVTAREITYAHGLLYAHMRKAKAMLATLRADFESASLEDVEAAAEAHDLLPEDTED